MQDNILVAVLLAVTFVTPAFAWLFYLWYRSHVAQMHREGQIFNGRNRDRAQANYEPANAAQYPMFGPYFTPRGWVRPKTRGLSHVLRPPQYVHTRQPVFTGNPNSDQHSQGPNQASTHSPQRANQQPNPLSKRQQRKQRALQNKQRQQQQSQNEPPNKQNRQNQRKQKCKNQGQNRQKSPNVHSLNAQGAQDEQYHQWGNTEGQNDHTSNHGGGGGWGNDESPQDNQHSAGQNENDNGWGSNFNNDQGGLKNSGSCSPRRGSRDNHNSPQEKSAQWGNQHHDDHTRSDGRGGSNKQQHHHNGWSNSRPASPDQVSINEADFGGGWGQSNHGGQETSYPRSNHSNEDHNRYGGWGDDDTKSYKKNKGNRHASPERKSRNEADTGGGWGQSCSGTRRNSTSWSDHPNEDHNRYYGWGDDDTKGYKKRKGSRYASSERKSRGRSSPNRDWGNSWGHAEGHRGGSSPTWGQDGNVHREKKKKKERWQIELEENAKRRRSRSPSQERSDAGWDKRSQRSGWKEIQKW